MVENDNPRVSLNLRIDTDKHSVIESMRKTGFGLATTQRHRSDVYNEVIGYGLQTMTMKMEMGDRNFERLWRVINKMNWEKYNLEHIEKLVGASK